MAAMKRVLEDPIFPLESEIEQLRSRRRAQELLNRKALEALDEEEDRVLDELVNAQATLRHMPD